MVSAIRRQAFEEEFFMHEPHIAERPATGRLNRKSAIISTAVAVLVGATVWSLLPGATDVKIGELYQVRVHQENAVEGVGDGVFTVEFVGENREMRDQYVPAGYARLVTSDPDLPPGYGRWTQIEVVHPEQEGIDYGTDGYRVELQFNGVLDRQVNYPSA